MKNSADPRRPARPSLRRAAPLLVVLAGVPLAGCQSLDNYFARHKATSSGPAVSGSNARPAPVDMAAAAVVRGQTLENQGLYEQALAEFESAIATNPRMTVAYLGAGDIYREKGDYVQAERRYAAAAQIEPK